MSSAGFKVLATSNNGVAFEQVALVEGVQAWPDSEERITGIPSHLVGGALLRCPRSALVSGTSVTATAIGGDVRIYVAVEALRADAGPIRDGGLTKALACTRGWLLENSAPSWCGEASTMTMFSSLAFSDDSIVLPRIVEEDAVVLILAVPISTGIFGAGLTCSSRANYDRMVVVEEGVVAWRDRDHRYMGMPSYLLGGLLFQGPYKDVPEGTVLSVRPNSRAKVYVVLERSTNGGLGESLPASGWMRENGAPRWHEMPTMLTYSHDCPAGTALTLPATRGSTAMFSVIVMQASCTPVAPVEVSCCTGGQVGDDSPVASMDMVPLTEGIAGWHDDQSKRLTKVPEWMLGATLVRGASCGPPASAVVTVRPVAPSVVYVILEGTSADGNAGRSGGLLPSVLPGSGWEPRQDVPEWSDGTKLVVHAKRVAARDVLSLPAIIEQGAVFLLVVKVDLEAFDASVETSLGLEYCRGPMAETAVAWSDRQNRWTWVPTFMNGGILFRGPHDSTPTGTTLRVTASGAFRVYVIVESEYKGSTARSGGFLESLPAGGWTVENSAPSWGDIASTMKVFSMKVSEGVELALPATSGPAVFSLVVVSVASGPDRLAEEMKRSFRAWDAQGLGGIRKEDLGSVLAAICPSIAQNAREELLAWADRSATGVVGYEEFVDRLLLASPAA